MRDEGYRPKQGMTAEQLAHPPRGGSGVPPLGPARESALPRTPATKARDHARIAVDAGGYIRCQGCSLPVARVQDGVLIIESRHFGDKHVNVFRLEDVVELLERERRKECA